MESISRSGGIGEFSPVVIAPVYNNAATLEEVLDRIAALDLPIIVVDDGSTDHTPAVIAQWLVAHSDFCCITHENNRGKAAALRTGFAAALQMGYSHAVTIDTDGQLDPEDIPLLLETARENRRSLVLGSRDIHVPNYPANSRIGRKLSNFAILLECGEKVVDSQCGLRVYPLEIVQTVSCRSSWFGFETEVITRAVWAGFSVREVPVVCRYFSGEKRITHFKVCRDSFRHLLLHFRLLGRALWPVPHKRAIEAAEKTWRTAEWREFAKLASPRKLWGMLRGRSHNRTVLACALALGVFIGNLPLYGLQTVLSIYFACRLHLPPVAVIAGSYISTPPLGPILNAAAIWLGHLMLTGNYFTAEDFASIRTNVASFAGRVMLDWAVGSIIVGGTLAVLTFIGGRFIIGFLPAKEAPAGQPEAQTSSKLINATE